MGPFERTPYLAVAVSGGSDSLALALLTHRWARARGGAVLALTVDHGLRPDSADEAATLGKWLAAHGIAHRILEWRGEKPVTAVQATARVARRALLLDACKREGILHLLLAHQQDDQAETLMLRLAADSGRDGLAGMAAVDETADVRILRPLLEMPRARLVATLTDIGQDWVRDPSNSNPRFARVTARDLTATPQAFARTADGFAAGRAERENALSALLASSVAIHPEGWATLDRAAFGAAPADLARRALARILLTVGGNDYPPRGERLDRLYAAIVNDTLGRGRTLAGCRLVPRKDGILVLRELAAMGSNVSMRSPGTVLWDNRFDIQIAATTIAGGCVLRALGPDGWYDFKQANKSLPALAIPPVVGPTLPALWDLEGVREIPHLLYRRRGADPVSVRVVSAVFRPAHVLAGAGFGVMPPHVKSKSPDND